MSEGNITPFLRDARGFFAWTICAFCIYKASNTRDLSAGECLDIGASAFALSTLYVWYCRRDWENNTTKTSAGRCDCECLQLASRTHVCTSRRNVRPGAFQIGQLLNRDRLKFGGADREAAWRLLEKLQAAGANVEGMRVSSSGDCVRASSGSHSCALPAQT